MGSILSYFFTSPSAPSTCSETIQTTAEIVQPWRDVAWGDNNKEQMLQKLRELQLRHTNISQLRILLCGPIGSGKSSFINSVCTTIQGCNTADALADSATDVKSYSFTRKFKLHQLLKDETGCYPFVLGDIMGLEPGSRRGVLPEDINNILLGHIKEGYTFHSDHPVAKDDPYYKHFPKLKHKVHCLVSVLPADSISRISEEVMQKMKTVREKARDLEIPQVIVMTMVDKACPLVKGDIEKVYTSKKVKEKMQECSNRLGVPMNCIFPVENYHEQITNNTNMDILVLMAITEIINFASRHVKSLNVKQQLTINL